MCLPNPKPATLHSPVCSSTSQSFGLAFSGFISLEYSFTNTRLLDIFSRSVHSTLPSSSTIVMLANTIDQESILFGPLLASLQQQFSRTLLQASRSAHPYVGGHSDRFSSVPVFVATDYGWIQSVRGIRTLQTRYLQTSYRQRIRVVD